MPLGSLEEELAKIAANDATIAKYDAELQSLVAKKEQLAMDIIDAGYPQDMLDQIGVVEKEIMATEDKIAEVAHTNEIIILANRLQLQRTLDIEPEEVVEEDIPE